MSEEENRFDQLIQEKFSSKDFPFDEENWEKAEAKMDADKKRKRFLWISSVFLFGLVAGIAVMLPFVNAGSSNENKIIVQVVSKEKTAPKIPSSSNKIIAERKNEQSSSIKNASDLPASENSKRTSGPSVAPENNSAKTIKQNKVNTGSPNENSKNSSAGQKKQERKEETADAVNSSSAVSPKENNVSQTENDHNEIKNSSTDLSSGITSTTHTKKADSIPFANINEADNKKLYGIIKDSSSNGIVNSPPKDTAEIRKDSIIANAISSTPMVQAAPQKLASTTIFTIEAGAHYGFGWNYSDGMNEGKGFDPILGFGFTHFFNTKWSLSSGIQYGSAGHLNSEKIYSSSKPDFGLTISDTIIDTRWIHYAVVPLFVHYNFNNKNSIGIGGSVGYLINTTSDIITDSQSDFKAPVQTKVRSFGYLQGFNSWNATVAFAYRRRITDRINITAEAHYGLTDIKNDAFFSRQKTERSSGIKFMISYEIFNH